jgi:zinc transporter
VQRSDRDAGLIAALLLDGQGGARSVGWNEIRAWTPEAGMLWVHLDRAVDAARLWLVDESGVPPVATLALMQEETRPRCTHFGPHLLSIFRAVNHNPGAEPEDMISLRCWMEPRRLISLRTRQVLAVQEVRGALEQGEGPTSIGDLLAAIALRVVEHVGPVVEEIEEALCKIEEDASDAPVVQLRRSLGDMRRQAIELRKFLSPQRDMLGRMSLEMLPWITDTDRGHIREASDRLTRQIEELDSMRDRSAITHEELSTRLNELLNRRLYALSLVSTTFLPLTFLTGLFGMNVGGIPFAEHDWGLWLVLGVAITIAAVQFWYFRHRRWL